MKADTIVYEKKNSDVRLAVLSEGRMVEFDTFSENSAVEGNVYLGRIVRKIELASGHTAFKVNIGDTQDAFLNASEPDLKEVNMSEGQSVVVQVSQEKRAEKGAKLVRNIQIVGTTVVYRPFRMGVDVSSKITDKEKIKEYRSAVFSQIKGQEGWAIRTAAIDFDINTVLEEMVKLRNIYENIRIRARNATAPALLYTREDPLYEYIRRHKDDLKKIVLNNHNIEKDVQGFIDLPVEYDANPFETYGLEDELIEALSRSVSLKSGGKIYIDQTKACVTIDVDSGSTKEGSNAYDLNNEAAEEIVRQIRLKNLSGKIIIDFAGSKEYHFMKPVIEILESGLADDPSKAHVLGLSKAGNIEILRQRRRPSLIDMYTEDCPTCQGTGRVEK
ncbi:MAG: ribonuclease E/G [Alphaproteobacteria bacterium]|nr:ribonuclease E/G [Alphaproteobacteria bacterium]